MLIAMFLVTSPIVINVPTSGLLACVAGGMASAKARNKVLAAEPP